MSKLMCVALLVFGSGQAFGQARESFVARQPIAESEVALGRAMGKHIQLDPATGERLVLALRDSLPAGWRSAPMPGEGRVDSFGNPIVNDRPGWPAYSRRDIDGLLVGLAERRDALLAARASGAPTAELERALGGVLGEAVVRGIDVDAIVLLEDAGVVTARVASGVMDAMTGYEHARWALSMSERAGFDYVRSEYGARVRAFVESHGRAMNSVLALPGQFSDRGVPSGCYNRYAVSFAYRYGANGTTLWQQDNTDDAFADIPIGWNTFTLFGCNGQNLATNSMLRVSTNGYATVFQQGGGALNGAEWANTPIGTAGGPNGFMTPSWDDYFVAPQQSPQPDRIWYETVGEVGHRTCYITWESVSKLGGGTADLHWFQIQIDEATDAIALVLEQIEADGEESATRGMENVDGVTGDCFQECDAAQQWVYQTRLFMPPGESYPPAPNDNCADATVVHDGDTVVQTALGNTQSAEPMCVSPLRDWWYSFTAPSDGMLIVSGCGTSSTYGTDAALGLYAACGTQPLMCADDSVDILCTGQPEYTLDPVLRLPMISGQHVLARVGLINQNIFLGAAASTSFTFVNGGDACADAVALDGPSGSVHADLALATASGVAQCAPSPTVPDLWYSIQNTTGGIARLSVDTCGSSDYGAVDRGIDTILSVWDRCGANVLACVDDSALACDQGGQYDAAASLFLAPGQTVFIRVTTWSVMNSRGDFFLNWNLSSCPADYNGDGGVDGDDVIAFFADWDSANAAADFNADGGVDGDDVIAFFAAWDSGC